MSFTPRKARFFLKTYLRHDLNAGVTVFFVALPLCLGISLASGAPVYSGLISGIIGGLVVALVSGSPLSVSGPAAGLTSICATAITELGGIEIFLLAVSIAGILQIFLGLLKFGGFTHFIPSAVIKGMLAAIGIILISKQIPLLIGYDKPDFWRNELFNLLTFRHGFEDLTDFYRSISVGPVIVAVVALGITWAWQQSLQRQFPFVPATMISVLAGTFMALLLQHWWPQVALRPSQYVNIPANVFQQFRIPDMKQLLAHAAIWRYAVLICFVASLETLLSVEAVDKLDAQKRITPQNRELVAQGTGNLISGLLGGLPITAVIVRSAANAEAGAQTRYASFTHGVLLLMAVGVGLPLLNHIPYSILAVILIRTGYNLTKPKMIRQIYRQGREQFLPFIVAAVAILFTDLLVGVLIGITYSIYFLVKHTYKAGFTLTEKRDSHTRHFQIQLALNVSFLNKKRIMELLDGIPPYAIVDIDGSRSIYIDHDILEIFQDFKTKAHRKHIQLTLIAIPEAEMIVPH